MTKVIYSMSVSLDGFITGPGGEIDWSVPSEELHSFHNERVRELGAHFLGRRLYEVMLYWEKPDPSWGPVEAEFAGIWQALPRVVFSTALESVEGNARLASAGIADEVAALRDRVPDGKDIGVGGAGLAAAFTELGLIDEYQLFVNPVVLGGGTPFFPPVKERIDLELLETRTFGSQVEYLRYRRV
jgi:dihydrofolate reductase